MVDANAGKWNSVRSSWKLIYSSFTLSFVLPSSLCRPSVSPILRIS